jgi:glycerol-3-phosphate dehydrogenase
MAAGRKGGYRVGRRKIKNNFMNRQNMVLALEAQDRALWDICIIGGGATGLGVAVDAASRGFTTLLLEQHDFAKGTSSRATKLVHGGVRYLQQGNIKLVTEALHERGILWRNAPHLVKNMSFIVPNYKWWEGPFYGIGLKVYDWMAGNLGLGKSRLLSREETLELAPTLDDEGLRGGVLYHDGQFDDARLAIHLAMTAAEQGAVLLNFAGSGNC